MVNNAGEYKKYERKPSFVSQKIFSKNFAAIHEIKPVLTIDKPIYVGFSILDLSKLLINEFHYKYIKSKYNAKLLFTDTDSLVYDIETDDVYLDVYGDKNVFDFSDYPRDSKLFDSVNKKVIGKMKDEFKGKIISEFVGLNSKLYSLVVVDGKENIKSKVVNTNVAKSIRHKEFVDALFNKKIMRYNMKRIQIKLHRYGLMMSAKFLCLVLTIKDTY